MKIARWLPACRWHRFRGQRDLGLLALSTRLPTPMIGPSAQLIAKPSGKRSPSVAEVSISLTEQEQLKTT